MEGKVTRNRVMRSRTVQRSQRKKKGRFDGQRQCEWKIKVQGLKTVNDLIYRDSICIF